MPITIYGIKNCNTMKKARACRLKLLSSRRRGARSA
jgi:hypothetical protein